MEELLQELIKYAADDYTEEQDDFLRSLLNSAAKEVVRKRYKGYSFRNEQQKKKAEDDVLLNYDEVILKIAKYHYDKQGKEGVTGWSENGVSASYESAGTPPSYFDDVIPKTRIVRGG